jgi:hypothetical protein
MKFVSLHLLVPPTRGSSEAALFALSHIFSWALFFTRCDGIFHLSSGLGSFFLLLRDEGKNLRGDFSEIDG